MEWWGFGFLNPLWTPANTATGIWIDGSDTSTIIQSSGLISQINDKSGNGINVTASGAARPSFLANSLNGYSTIRFPTGTQLTLPSTFSGFNNTYLMLLLRESSGNITPLILGAASYAYLHYGDNWYTSAGSSSTVAMNADTWYMNTSINGTKYSNGSSSEYSATSSGGSLFNSIGSSFSNTPWRLAQFIFIPGLADIATVQKIEGYWAHRYGLTASLPAGHPYKNSPPTIS